MRLCPNCNTNNFDVDINCKKCGYPLDTDPFEAVVTIPEPSFYVKSIEPTESQRVARAFMIFMCVLHGLSAFTTFALWIVFLALKISQLAISFLISMFIILPTIALCIYMTCNYSHKIENGIKVETSFKVITLLFVSFIAGILMFCDNNNQYA